MAKPLPVTSRYHITHQYLDDETDDRYWTQWRPPRYGIVNEKLHVVNGAEIDRIDNIAFTEYETPFLWWLVLYHNNISDPMTLEAGDKLKIPDFTAIDAIFKRDLKLFKRDITESIDSPPKNVEDIQPYLPPPYNRPGTQTDILNINPEDPFLFNFGFPVPECIQGQAHFQIQVSEESDFDPIVMSKITSTSTERWFYYDPFVNGGAGSHRPFPQNGINASSYTGNPVYFQFKESDPLKRNFTYYVRFRVWVNDLESRWYSAPPMRIC